MERLRKLELATLERLDKSLLEKRCDFLRAAVTQPLLQACSLYSPPPTSTGSSGGGVAAKAKSIRRRPAARPSQGSSSRSSAAVSSFSGPAASQGLATAKSPGVPPPNNAGAGVSPRRPAATQPDDRPRPFRNLGNTCYMNACLVAFFGPTRLRTCMEEMWGKLSDDVREQLIALAKLDAKTSGVELPANITVDARLASTYMFSFQQPRGVPQSPNVIYNAYPNPDCQQRDAHEFLLDLHEGAPELFEHLTTLVESSLRCSRCGASRVSALERHSVLSIDIQDPAGASYTLQEGLDAWLQSERAAADYRWLCPDLRCGSTAAPMKHHTIRLAAPVLALHLKRWPRDPRDGLIASVVEPPQTLAFADLTYCLRSFILHRGSTVKGGHYVAVMHQRCGSKSEWWYYNDALRRAALASDLSTSQEWKSYICFYEQQT